MTENQANILSFVATILEKEINLQDPRLLNESLTNCSFFFFLQENNSERNRKYESKVNSSAVNDIMKIITESVESLEKTQNRITQPASTEQIILEAELGLTKQELKYHIMIKD